MGSIYESTLVPMTFVTFSTAHAVASTVPNQLVFGCVFAYCTYLDLGKRVLRSTQGSYLLHSSAFPLYISCRGISRLARTLLLRLILPSVRLIH